MITIEIPARTLLAMAELAAQKDTRYYLQGVLVDIPAAGECRLVATDGHAVGITRLDTVAAGAAVPQQFILPRDLVRKFKPKDGALTVRIEDDDPNGRTHARPVSITAEASGLTASGSTIDGIFPDYRRVIPHEPTGEAAQLNVGYLIAFAKALSMLSGCALKSAQMRVGIRHNGSGGALVSFAGHDDFVGVLMPLRIDATLTEPPAWVLPCPAHVAAAA